MPYTQLLSNDNPGYIVILIDQSSSMGSHFPFSDSGISKSDECVNAVNQVLREICLHSARRIDGYPLEIRNRCCISVLRYGGPSNDVMNAFTSSALKKKVLTISDLVENVTKIVKQKRNIVRGERVEVVEDEYPIWIESNPDNFTPMAEAFEEAYQLVEAWIRNHPNSFPPVVINITDGQPNDEEETVTNAMKLMNTKTTDGNTLIINAHIPDSVNSDIRSISLPSDANTLRDDPYAQLLFSISSQLPPIMIERARTIGLSSQQGSRGFIYNAKVSTMIKLLNIGSIIGNI